MRGHKWEYFVLNLSFIGWFLLSSLTFGLLLFYVMPYYQATMAEYYRYLKEEQETPRVERPRVLRQHGNQKHRSEWFTAVFLCAFGGSEQILDAVVHALGDVCVVHGVQVDAVCAALDQVPGLLDGVVGARFEQAVGIVLPPRPAGRRSPQGTVAPDRLTTFWMDLFGDGHDADGDGGGDTGLPGQIGEAVVEGVVKEELGDQVADASVLLELQIGHVLLEAGRFGVVLGIAAAGQTEAAKFFWM